MTMHARTAHHRAALDDGLEQLRVDLRRLASLLDLAIERSVTAFLKCGDLQQGFGIPPAFKNVVFRTILEPATALAELLAGGVDIVYGLAGDDAARVKSASNARLLTGPSPFLKPFASTSSAFSEPRCGVPNVMRTRVSFQPPSTSR